MKPVVADQIIAADHSARWPLASLSLATLLAALDNSSASVALPALTQAFGASFQAVQWVVLAYLVALTALVVVTGRLGDRFGRRRVLLGGLGLFTVASALCGAAPSLWLLVAGRAAQGAGAAAMLALTLALVGESVPKARAGSAMGLIGTMSAIGTALGPSLGGFLIAGSGWRAIFLVNLPLGLLALLLAWRNLPADRPAPKIAASPLIPFALLRDRALSAGLATSLLVSTVIMATLVVGPFHLSRALGLDAALTGLVVSAGPVVAALTGVPAGRLADRFGASRMTITGLVAIAAGALVLSMMPLAAGTIGYVAPLVVITAGYALFQTANNTAVMRDVGADRRGVVSGLLNLSRNLGLVAGASVMGAVFALGSAAADVATAAPEAVAAGTRVTFAAAAVLIGAALAIAGRAVQTGR